MNEPVNFTTERGTTLTVKLASATKMSRPNRTTVPAPCCDYRVLLIPKQSVLP
jgi:hypothetical protein